MRLTESSRSLRILLALISLVAGGAALFSLLPVELASSERLVRALLAAAGLIIAVAILVRTRKPSTRQRRVTKKSFTTIEEKQLLILCGGNKRQAERLISYHSQQIPVASRRQAASRAIDAIHRDRR